jgi:hypothetical protein
VIRLFEGNLLASTKLLRNREFHIDLLGHTHISQTPSVGQGPTIPSRSITRANVISVKIYALNQRLLKIVLMCNLEGTLIVALLDKPNKPALPLVLQASRPSAILSQV